MKFKSGFIAIIGRPNVGKSTLLNTILGEKVAIVSSKPQTTRKRLRGVRSTDSSQIVFIDTPGVHEAKGIFNEFMVKEAFGALSEVDGALFLIDAYRGKPGPDELLIMKNLSSIKAPVMLVINKVDMVEKDKLLPLIKEFSSHFDFKEVFPLSALKDDGVEQVLKALEDVLPEGPKYFPDDILTDELERHLASEIIREKVFTLTHEEIPYSVAVVIEEFKERERDGLISIQAAINVERDSQKGIVIGKKGMMLKRIGTEARKDIERLLGAKVFLKLFVRVDKDWTKKPSSLKEYGYRG